MEKVLITGISGGQGRLLARRLMDRSTRSAASTAWIGKGHPEGVRSRAVDLTRKKFEDVIRTELPTHIVHMGFIRHFRTDERTRYDVNVRGTRKLLDHCVHHGVQSLVVMSSSYVYGAFPENPVLHGRGLAALGQSLLSRDSRPRRGRHPRHRVSVALPAHPDLPCCAR